MTPDQSVPPTPPPAKTHTGYWIVSLVVVLLVGLGLGIAIGQFALPHPAASPAPTASPKATPAPSPKATPTPDPTAGWTPYSDSTDQYSLRYPSAWLHRTCESGGHTSLFLAPTTATLGACNSDFGGQMMLAAASGDQRTAYTLVVADGYGSLTSADVTIGGVTGTRQSATVTAAAQIGPAVGTKVVRYVFYTAGRTYLASYSQVPTAPNTLADFDLMIKTTLKFTP